MILHSHPSSLTSSGQSLILLHQYSIGCFVVDSKLLLKPMVTPWEVLHCLVLIPSRHLGGEKEELEHWKRDWQLRGWPLHGVLKS
ncbi:hypothetical protein NC653_008729 [Populus alba x Populus x berolinensis]|uniref:Uncharacterized protein n=1 Tax=Populus alba x Populus x berolinensis TaxID=444605 RepID=A0AAD6W8T3_9ROSI|nr:hypothetical protein NC653_008729 [Populus alba x Populus x berolinensis]